MVEIPALQRGAIALGGALLMAAAPAAPKPGTLETYKDWIIGCDNGGRCQAGSLVPEADSNWDDALTLTVERDAGAAAQPVVRFHSQKEAKGELALLIDGVRLAKIPAAGTDDPSLSGAAAMTAIRAMAKGQGLELRAGTAVLGKASLAGSSAALRYMDAKQGRAGTTTALVALGKLGPTAVKPAPALPLIRRAAVPQKAGPPLWRTEVATARKLTGCDADDFGSNGEPEVHMLDGNRALVLLPCGAGAYNFSSSPLIATGNAGRRSFAIASFDSPPGWSGDEGQTQPLLVNAGWDAKTGTLSSFAKGRGIGDCGSAETYVWDGFRFRMTEASQMGECRGNWEWITVYRARTALK